MIALSFMLSFFSCTKDSTSIELPGIDLADDDAVMNAVYDDVFNTADNASIILDGMVKGNEAKSEQYLADSCPLITIIHPETGIWPKVITVDYGTGCTGFGGSTRSGKIVIEATGLRIEAGSVRTVTFDNYFFNEMKVEGIKEIENLGYNDNQNLVFSVTLSGGQLTLPDGQVIERSFEHSREWIAGILTRNIWDDECLVTGNATGKNINGIGYTNTILTALHWKRVCNFVVSGVIRIEREGKEVIELDYGNGECDAKAIVTRGEDSKEILLKNRHRNMMH